MDRFAELLAFVDLLHAYRAVERKVLVKNGDRDENDVEHSFSLAMLAWYINSTYELGLDAEKLFAYALAHDLVEVYAGDTFFYTKDTEALLNKHAREAEAAERLAREFPEFESLHNAIRNYEAREDRESKFIYALDKVEPALSIYMDRGRTWKKYEVTLDMIIEAKTPKVANDPTVKEIFDELVKRFIAEHDALFGGVQ